MHYRRFGRTGWNVSEVGYGMWGLAGWTGSEDTESLASLQRSVDLGCNFFDTAWAYGDGHSEQLLGKILQANKANAAVGGPDAIRAVDLLRMGEVAEDGWLLDRVGEEPAMAGGARRFRIR